MEITELKKPTIQAWRNFLGTEAAQIGILHLLARAAPTGAKPTVPEMVEQAHKWSGYVEALTDLEGILTRIPDKETALEEPPMER